MWNFFSLFDTIVVVNFMNVNEINVLVLAYLGDTIYENYIRKYLIGTGIGNVNELQKAAVNYVSAKSQAKYLSLMIESNFLTNKEINIVKRARNYKTTSHPKNCDIITYKCATGLECLIGYLDLDNRRERIDEIMNFVLEK
jgi:ribonuclease-3 family protein